MRKTSQDGSDNTSVTGKIENEIKKSTAINTKKTSIKRKVQSLSHESDDAVIEPLLKKEDDKIEMRSANQSANSNLLSKMKIESIDKTNILQSSDSEASLPFYNCTAVDTVTSTCRSDALQKSTSGISSLHNHMNTNVFNDTLKGFNPLKSHILVELDGAKSSGYSPSPLIFTTAKIHTDDQTKHVESLQVTPVPILSTIEVSIHKGKGTNENGNETTGRVTSQINTGYTNTVKSNANASDKGKNRLSDNSEISTSKPNGKMVKSSENVKNTMGNEFSTSQDTKVSESKLTTNNTINNRNISINKVNNSINNEEKTDRNTPGKQTKNMVSQGVNSLSSDKLKPSTDLGDIIKTVTPTIPTTGLKQIEKNINAFNHRNAGQSQSFDNMSPANIIDKNVIKGSTENKQLRRQKAALDEPISKVNSTTDSLSTGKNIANVKNLESLVPLTDSRTPQLNPGNDISSLSDKTILSKSTANSIQVNSSVTPISHKINMPPSTNSIRESNTSTIASSAKPDTNLQKTAISIPKIPTTKPKDDDVISITQPSSAAKHLSNSSTLIVSETKPIGVECSKPSSSSPLVDTVTKTINASMVEALPSLSTNKQASALQSKKAVTKTAPQAAGSKSIENIKQNSPVSIDVVKQVPQATASKSIENTKQNLLASNSATKLISQATAGKSIEYTKQNPSIVKLIPQASDGKSIENTKLPIAISVARSPKSSKESIKNSSLTGNNVKPSVAKVNIASVGDATTPSPSSSVSTLSKPTIATLTSNTVSSEKKDAKSTEIINSNKNLKS